MPIEIKPLVEPASTAVVVFECQQGILSKESPLPGLARAAQQGDLLGRFAKLLRAAREAEVKIFYVTAAKRADGLGNAFNTPIERRVRAANGQAFDAGPVCPEVAPQPGELVIARQHGLTGFFESGLDAYLRNTGVRSIVLGGVSANLGIIGTAIEAVNRGYAVVVPRDCVAGDPPEYAEQLLRFSLRNIAFLASSEEVARAWGAGAS